MALSWTLIVCAPVLLLCVLVCRAIPEEESAAEQEAASHLFQMSDLLKQQADKGAAWLPFLEESSMQCGIYVLPEDGIDGQTPHGLDEVYYVLEGKGRITIADRTMEIEAGSLVYVRAHVMHKFHDIEEQLKTLVFFPKQGKQEPGGR